MALDGVGPFSAVQRRKPTERLVAHPLLSFGRMTIRDIQGNQKACIEIDAQTRPRSEITRSAPGKIRSPKSFLRRAAKSGQMRGWLGAVSGTIRATIRSRSRNSTVLPARSHALSRGVSRSCRILITGMALLWHIMCHAVNPPCRGRDHSGRASTRRAVSYSSGVFTLSNSISAGKPALAISRNGSASQRTRGRKPVT